MKKIILSLCVFTCAFVFAIVPISAYWSNSWYDSSGALVWNHYFHKSDPVTTSYVSGKTGLNSTEATRVANYWYVNAGNGSSHTGIIVRVYRPNGKATIDPRLSPNPTWSNGSPYSEYYMLNE